jgi:hypothetical protein
MSRRIIYLAVGVLVFSAFVFFEVCSTTPQARALPTSSLMLPWPGGPANAHRINGGYTYGCGTHRDSNYYAIDFQFAIGEEVSSVTNGIVTEAVGNDQSNGGRGNYVEIDHGNGYRSRYLHLRRTDQGAPFPSYVKSGATVSMGQVIGYAGTTGFSSGPHLHFDLKLNGRAFKPEPMSGVTGFGWWGFSAESGLGCGSNAHDPSPYWDSARDLDGDGYSEAFEPMIGTSPTVRCDEGPNDPSAGWPSDFKSGGIPTSTDRVTLVDLTSFLGPVRRAGTSPGENGWSPRWDLVPGPQAFTSWINIQDLTAIIAGTTGRPPMFGGQRAYHGPTCTD